MKLKIISTGLFITSLLVLAAELSFEAEKNKSRYGITDHRRLLSQLYFTKP